MIFQNKLDWDKAPDGATHALFTTEKGFWYFWKVTTDPITTHYHDGNRWIKHHYQSQTITKLHSFPVERRYPDDTPTTGTTTMNLDNAALLVRDDINTVSVIFEGTSKKYTYILHESIKAEVGDTVLVPAQGSPKSAEVVEIHEQPNIDPNSSMTYSWVICNLAEHITKIRDLKALSDRIVEKLKQQQAKSVREQVLAQFGVSNVKELLGLPSSE